MLVQVRHWMKCAWCGSLMRVGSVGAATSHGMCTDCEARIEMRWGNLPHSRTLAGIAAGKGQEE